MKNKTQFNSVFIIAMIINALLIIGYMYFWIKSLRSGLLPEGWEWGDTTTKHEQWGWGENSRFDRLFHCFLFCPILSGMISLIKFNVKTKWKIYNVVISITLFTVALNHWWLIDS